MIGEDHLLDIVDENDHIIGVAVKDQKYRQGLISRTVVGFVKDRQNRYIIAKRSPHKKIFANLWDISTCGNIYSGESCEEAIAREIKEELGFSCKVNFLKKMYLERLEKGILLKYFAYFFVGVTDQDPKLNDELTEYKKIDLITLMLDIKTSPDKYSPFFIDELNLVKDRLI